MIKLADSDKCTGCMACYNSCVQNAINLKVDVLGRLHPSINESLCISCKMCVRSCPVLKKTIFLYPKQAIAAYTKNKNDRNTCSSGGIATSLGRSVIAQGGCVFGAGFSSSGECVMKKAETQEQLEEFKGSKYIFCNAQLIYRDVKKAAETGNLCLFVGTPCQVDGLNSFLKKD